MPPYAPNAIGYLIAQAKLRWPDAARKPQMGITLQQLFGKLFMRAV